MHVGAERDERVEADVLRELVVERRRGRAPSGRSSVIANVPVLPRKSSRGCSAGNVCSAVDLVADVLADEGGVDLRERLTGAELELHALAAAVLDFFAVDREREVDRDDVALLRGTRGLGRLQRGVALAKRLEPARPAKEGDVVTIDFTLSVDGKEIKDGGGQGVQLELGAGQAFREIDAALVGKSNGESSRSSRRSRRITRARISAARRAPSPSRSRTSRRASPRRSTTSSRRTSASTRSIALRADVHTKLEKALKDRAETALAEQIVAKLNEPTRSTFRPRSSSSSAAMMEQEVVMQARRPGQRFTREQAQHSTRDPRRRGEEGPRRPPHGCDREEERVQGHRRGHREGLLELAAETGKNVAKVRVEYREK